MLAVVAFEAEQSTNYVHQVTDETAVIFILFYFILAVIYYYDEYLTGNIAGQPRLMGS